MQPIEQVRKAIEQHGRPVWIAHVPMNIVRQVPYRVLGEMLATARIVKADDKKRIMFNYLQDNTYNEITIEQITEIMGVSEPTARKFIKENAGWFKKVSRGVWEIRDPKKDRK